MASPLIPPKFFWVTTAGLPAVGYKLNSYIAGTNTPQATYPTNTDATNLTNANANPTILDSNGSANIWLPTTLTYKFILQDASNNTIWTVDNQSQGGVSGSGGGGGGGGTTGSEWVLYGSAPTFISSTSFSVTGDQRATFDVSRKIKSTNTGGTAYSTISASAFSSVTTVTVVNDTGSPVLDSGMSAVSYALLDGISRSVPVASFTNITQTTGGVGAPTSGVPQVQFVTAGSPVTVIDVLGEFTAANGRFTAKNAGWYRVSATASVSTSGVTFSGGANQVYVCKNGSTATPLTNISTFGAALFATSLSAAATSEGLIQLNATDYIQVVVTSTFSAGSPLTGYCSWTVQRVA